MHTGIFNENRARPRQSLQDHPRINKIARIPAKLERTVKNRDLIVTPKVETMEGECLSYYREWERAECKLQHPPPQRGEYVNTSEYMKNWFLWFTTSRSSDSYDCKAAAAARYRECLKNPPQKEIVNGYTSFISGFPHLALCNGIAFNSIEYDRVMGCDGGISPAAKNNDILDNLSKGIVNRCNYIDNTGIQGALGSFCTCPLGASYNLLSKQCACPAGEIPHYDKSWATAGNGPICCAPDICNKHPTFNRNNISTYEWMNCSTKTCELIGL